MKARAHPPSVQLRIEAMKKALSSSSLNKEDIEIIARIEEVRKRYLDNRTVVQIPDFGAGPGWKSFLGIKQPEELVREREISDVCSTSSIGRELAEKIYSICKAVQPKVSLELGTCLGISTAYIAMHSGLVHTFEGAPALSALAQENITYGMGLSNIEYHTGSFKISLPAVLDNLPQKIDFAFIDGHHEGRATLNYWNILKPCLASGAIVIFDDIRFNLGMMRAWNKLKSDHRCAKSERLGRMGLLILN
jgi:predicted O-methyltransferase YrrM